MSADQQTLSGDSHPAHLTKRTGSGHAGIPESSLGAHEWVCTDCGARITKSSTTGREYGHTRNPRCDHSVWGGGDE